MARVKEAAAETADSVAEGIAAAATADGPVPPSPKRVTRLSGPVRFALAVILSFAFWSLGRLLVDYCSDNEIRSISKEVMTRKEHSILAAWKLYASLAPSFR